MSEWQTLELKVLGGAVDTALLAEGMPIGQIADEPESELPSREEALEVGLGEVQREVLLKFVSSLAQTPGSHIGEDAALHRLPTVMGELLQLLQKTVRLAQVRGQRAQRLEQDLAIAREAVRASGGHAAVRQGELGLAAESPTSARDDQATDTVESVAVRLTAARKTIKEKEWELVEARKRVEQLERERARQEQRIRQLETVSQRSAWMRDDATERHCQSARLDDDENSKQMSPSKCSTRSPGRETCLVQDEIANIEQSIEKRRIRFEVDVMSECFSDARVISARDDSGDRVKETSTGVPCTSDAKLKHHDGADDIGRHGVDPLTKTYLVDNSLVNSTTKGLSFRLSKELQSKDGNNLVVWGTLVRGTDEGDGWVKVGDRYLPQHVGGVSVLSIQDNDHVNRDCALGTVSSDSDGQHRTHPKKGASAVAVAVPQLVGLPAIAPTSPDDLQRQRMAAASKQPGTQSLPMDLRALGKLLSGHAVKTPRR
mmetsp:Transcript_105471/g.264091  ORF Transcript_105471/g.264091 Transcript_105471/m.264091 type:complete len:487 (+) Transcript_105471:151-1611(+)|eukprot:CAMPEP_0115307476 /NCGR_PEP_ID=MMETSP0270-20121206/73161_1 /TAXON_ID=71861 /ORGANISM="Scrippsiella trochoidea, Strain CCMP3099" /LENGTH=486 /DNA_ID=CAMNT_0002725921 /DNA_START=68 /DNA_END=1528 /DNA_ORIENTATION=+